MTAAKLKTLTNAQLSRIAYGAYNDTYSAADAERAYNVLEARMTPIYEAQLALRDARYCGAA